MTIEFSTENNMAVRQAIKKAEKKTSAEIYAVLAERSDDYRFVAASILAFWILAMSILLVLWARWQGLQIGALLLVAAQLSSFLCGLFVMWVIPSIPIMMTPRSIKYRRAHLNAINQFLAHGIHHTSARTGVLIFVSLEERYAEIMVDSAIEKIIGRDHWLDSVAVLIERCKSGEISRGFEEVIAIAGLKLAEEFPGNHDNINELEDKLVII